MKKIYIVLANSTSATFYSVSNKDRHLSLVKKLNHPEGLLKESDLDSDKPGHYQKGNSSSGGSFVARVTHKELKKKHFAKSICQELEKNRVANTIDNIIIITEPNFYGLINQEASKHKHQSISFHLPKDYTNYSEKNLKIALAEILKYEINMDFAAHLTA